MQQQMTLLNQTLMNAHKKTLNQHLCLLLSISQKVYIIIVKILFQNFKLNC